MYNRSMRKLCLALIFLFLFFLLPQSVSAHGSGPPFLKINNKFAQSNPYYQGGAVALSVAQDLPPETYLVNSPIHFVIDKSQLLFSPEIVNEVTFRWSFQERDTAYKYGDTIDYTYAKMGSYLVRIEAKIPGESYVLIDTVQINVLPNKTYTLPTSELTVGSNLKTKEPLVVVSKGQADPSTKITASVWDVGEGTDKLKAGSTLCFSVGSNYFTEVYHRVTDSNGFYTDTGFSLTSIDDKLQVNPAGYGVRPPIVRKYEDIVSFKDRFFGPCGSIPPVLCIIGGVMGLGIIGVFSFMVFSKRKRFV